MGYFKQKCFILIFGEIDSRNLCSISESINKNIVKGVKRVFKRKNNYMIPINIEECIKVESGTRTRRDSKNFLEFDKSKNANENRKMSMISFKPDDKENLTFVSNLENGSFLISGDSGNMDPAEYSRLEVTDVLKRNGIEGDDDLCDQVIYQKKSKFWLFNSRPKTPFSPIFAFFRIFYPPISTTVRCLTRIVLQRNQPGQRRQIQGAQK